MLVSFLESQLQIGHETYLHKVYCPFESSIESPYLVVCARFGSIYVFSLTMPWSVTILIKSSSFSSFQPGFLDKCCFLFASFGKKNGMASQLKQQNCHETELSF